MAKKKNYFSAESIMKKQSSRATKNKVITNGVYKIENTSTGKVYIGSSKNIEKRIKQHNTLLKKGIHSNRKLQSDWNINQGVDFVFSIVFATTENRERLYEIEQEFIDKHDSFGNSYNNVCATMKIEIERRNKERESDPMWQEISRRRKMVEQVEQSEPFKLMAKMKAELRAGFIK